MTVVNECPRNICEWGKTDMRSSGPLYRSVSSSIHQAHDMRFTVEVRDRYLIRVHPITIVITPVTWLVRYTVGKISTGQ